MLTSISISLDTGKHWLIANEKGLPYDAESLLALPMPVGGALVFSSNLVMYHKQKMEAALSVNEFGDRVTTLRVSPTQPTHCAPFCMERAAVAALAPDAFVIGTRAGDLHLLTLQTLGDSIRSMDVTRVTRSHIASCLCALSPSLLFIGSKLGDSLLVRYETVRLVRSSPVCTYTHALTDLVAVAGRRRSRSTYRPGRTTATGSLIEVCCCSARVCAATVTGGTVGLRRRRHGHPVPGDARRRPARRADVVGDGSRFAVLCRAADPHPHDAIGR